MLRLPVALFAACLLMPARSEAILSMPARRGQNARWQGHRAPTFISSGDHSRSPIFRQALDFPVLSSLGSGLPLAG